MARFVQLHFLTFYPPANLNRDDTGRPKTAIIGGVERLRISSQSLKRAVRTSDVFKAKLDGHLAQRTQRLGADIRKHLTDKGMEGKAALATARKIAEVFGKIEDEKADNPSYIRQLAFISPKEREAAFALADKALGGDAIDPHPDAVLAKVDTAADIAMFGRMLADNPDFNREAAVQVAHAYTTHRVTVEDDYYTAVDDLKTKAEDAGAGFIGELGFGSGLFYLYVCIDGDLLVANLDGNDGVAKSGVAALVEALATVSPSGKQASFASRARAEYLLVEKGSQQPRTERRAGFDRPGKSAILGLVAAGLGLERSDEVAHAALEDGYGLGLGEIASGRLLFDYHTTQTPPQRKHRRFPTRRAELAVDDLGTLLSLREYRTDPAYLVVLWPRGVFRWSLGKLAEALKRPHFTLYFGRKACPLSVPLDVAKAIAAVSVPSPPTLMV